MDVLEFQANPVTETFTRHGKSMSVTFNTDAFTPDFFRAAAQMLREIYARAKEGDTDATKALKKTKEDDGERVALGFDAKARSLEIQCEMYSRLLAGTPDTPVLMGWELTRNGAAVEISVDELRRLHPEFLLDLYKFCLEHSVPKSPEIPTTAASQTISVTTGAGSPTPATPADENLTTLTSIS